MRFDIITIFPQVFDSYFQESIIKRGREKGLLEICIHNLRDYTSDKHLTVDDRPYGGGPGMVLMVEPIYQAVKSIKSSLGKKEKFKTILLSFRGRYFNQKIANQFSHLDRIILICGHYEGVDERVAKYIADDEISVGDYILTGGELPAMIIVDSVSRLIPGVLGNINSIEEKRFSEEKNIISYPVYTKPEIFSPKKGVQWRVPKELLSGNHQKIEEWRKKHSRTIE